MRKGQCDDQVLGFDSVISFSVSGAANRLCTMNPSKQRKMLAYFTQRETHKSMCVPQARNAIHMGEELVRCYKYSPKRQQNVDTCIDDMTDGERSTTKSKELCRTRWMARHDDYSMISLQYISTQRQ